MTVLVNRAKVTTATTGTGTITLGSAFSGYQTFASAGVTNGQTVRYVIEDGASWEIGTGTYSSTGPTLTRTPSESSNGGAAINLSGGSTVFLTAAAEDILQPDNNLSDLSSAATARTNLGLGTAATSATGDFATAAQGALADSAVQPGDSPSFGSVTVTGTVDGRDVAADGTKLDGIEAGATADQTASEILTAIKTVDGAGSGLDADLLDGQHASAFAAASHTHTLSEITDAGTAAASAATDFVAVTGDSMTGQLVIDSGEANPLKLNRSSQVGIEFNDTSVGSRYLGVNGGQLWFGSNLNHGINERVFHDAYHPNADKLTTARNIALIGDVTGSANFDGSANISITATVADDSHNHVISNVDGLQTALDGKTNLDHVRSLGTTSFTAGGGSNSTTTTSALIGEMEGDGAFDSYTSLFKTSWSYATNDNLSDAGRFTETAGTSWITWTDNSSDTTRGNITALAIAPNTGGSAGGVFIYNDQGSSYAPGWREVWTSASDGSGSGLDADLLDGVQGSSYLRSDAADTKTSGDLGFSDNVKATFGAGSDLQIYHDGSNSYIQEDGTGNLRIRASNLWLEKNAGGEYYLQATADGAVRLYYDALQKLATTSTGVDVTGTVTATAFSGDGSGLTGIDAGATGGGTDKIFWENGQTVTTNYTITNGQNAMSAGPITINSGVTVTVGAGETWTVV